MYLEFCNYNRRSADKSEDKVKELFNAVELNFKSISTDLYILRKSQEFLKDLDISISVPVGYPLGKMDRKTKEHETLAALKGGASAIDLVINPYLVMDREFVGLADEVTSNLNICQDYNADLRITINYSLYPQAKSLSICNALQDCGIEFLIPSNGFYNDDISENLLMSKTIEKNTSLRVITSGQVWLKKQFDMVVKSKIFGLRLYSLNFLTNKGVN